MNFFDGYREGGEGILIAWLWSWTTVGHGKGRWGEITKRIDDSWRKEHAALLLGRKRRRNGLIEVGKGSFY